MLCSTPAHSSTNSASDILTRYEHANTVFFEREGLTAKESIEPRWIADSNLFWYCNTSGDEKEYILVNPSRATRQPAFDHEKLARILNQKYTTSFTASTLPLDQLTFFPGEHLIKFKIDTRWIQCDLDSYACKLSNAVHADAGQDQNDSNQRGRRRGRRPEGERSTKSISPDKQWEAVITNYNVSVKSTTTTTVVQLTFDGVKTNAYQWPEFSPDSKKLIVFKTLRGDHKKMYRIEALPKDSLRPALHSDEYALPGDLLDTFEPWILDIENQTAVNVDADRIDWDWKPPVFWEKDSSSVFYRNMYRGYQRYAIVKVDPDSGLSRIIIDERTDTSIQPDYEYLYYVSNTNELIWASERDGWHHLYLFDRSTGALKNQITSGDWFVRKVIHVDDEARRIIFTAHGREEGEDPYFIHYYSINFDGTGLVSLTPGNGSHDARFSPDWLFLVDNYSRVDMAPVTVLRNASDGSFVCDLEKADISKLLETGYQLPEPFCAKGRDGKTDIWGVMFRPDKLDTSKKYPVIELIYTGPQSAYTPKRFRNFYWIRAMCELGFIVVQVDGMGTALRSKAFHDVSYKNLGDGGLPDHIAWLHALQKKYPYVDAANVAVSGGSAGGYDAAHALITHPEVYKAAIANSGNHDHRTDKVWWNELWMGYPVTDVYKEQSNIENADKINGALFLIHGAMDNNVYCFASTMQFVDKLMKANKDFELLIVPDGSHCPGGDYVMRRQWDFFVKTLQGIEPPKQFTCGKREEKTEEKK